MNWRTPMKLARLLTQVKSPWLLVRDRLGLEKAPYLVHLRAGLMQELRPARGDLSAFRVVWMNRDYQSSGQRLAEGDTVVDVGANIGCFTLFAAQKVGRKGRVIAVEPDSETFHQLERNITLNRLENVHAMRRAVSGESGVMTFYHSSVSLFSSLYSSVDGRSGSGSAEEIPSITIGGIFEEQKIERCQFLKLNCEGAEHSIVRTLTADIARRIDQISMELHEVPGCDPRELVRRLENLGFSPQARGAFLHFTK